MILLVLGLIDKFDTIKMQLFFYLFFVNYFDIPSFECLMKIDDSFLREKNRVFKIKFWLLL